MTLQKQKDYYNWPGEPRDDLTKDMAEDLEKRENT